MIIMMSHNAQQYAEFMEFLHIFVYKKYKCKFMQIFLLALLISINDYNDFYYRSK